MICKESIKLHPKARVQVCLLTWIAAGTRFVILRTVEILRYALILLLTVERGRLAFGRCRLLPPEVATWYA